MAVIGADDCKLVKISGKPADMEAGSEGGTPKRDCPDTAKEQQTDPGPKTGPDPKTAGEVGGGCRARIYQTFALQPNRVQ